jgi:hypothetical protein
LKNSFNNIKDIVLIVLVGIILWKSCQKQTPSTNTVTIKETIKYDTISRIVPQYVPKITERIIREINWKDKDIDTSKILEDYFALYYYNDTVIKTDSLTVIVKDTITENKIRNRNANYTLVYQTKTIEKTELINKREFYYGASTVIDFNKSINNVSGEVLFKDKKGHAFGAGLGLNPTNMTPTVSARMYFKIGKQ